MMRWVIQNNFFNEDANVKLIEYLDRYKMNYDLVKVIPFGGGIEPTLNVNPTEKVVVIGSISLVKYAKEMGWTPGAWLNDNFDYSKYIEAHGDHMLNHNMKEISFREIPDTLKLYNDECVFMRPLNDGKEFAGTVFTHKDLLDWYDKIMQGDSMWSITKDTRIILNEPINIYSEYRFIVINNKIITGSLYKRGRTVIYSDFISEDILDYAKSRAAHWTPDKVCVMDISCDADGIHIIEFNNFNSAGWYLCDVSKIIGAVDNFVENGY